MLVKTLPTSHKTRGNDATLPQACPRPHPHGNAFPLSLVSNCAGNRFRSLLSRSLRLAHSTHASGLSSVGTTCNQELAAVLAFAGRPLRRLLGDPTEAERRHPPSSSSRRGSRVATCRARALSQCNHTFFCLPPEVCWTCRLTARKARRPAFL